MAESAKDAHDFQSLLSSPARDFLIRKDGEQVKIDSLKGKKLGLYFEALSRGPYHGFSMEAVSSLLVSLCGPYQQRLVEVYDEVSTKGTFEVVFVSRDGDEESFKECFSNMPWLAIPFTDSETRDRLDELFKVREIPTLVILDEAGKVVIENGIGLTRIYGVEAFPFTPERMEEIKEEEERARREQTLKSVLVSDSRDFLISRDGYRVPVSELKGRTIGLLFISLVRYGGSKEFKLKLIEVYKKLKEYGEDFEIVLISLNSHEEPFERDNETMPWLALPFSKKSSLKLARHFMLSRTPTLVILGPDGKTRHLNVAEAVMEYGVDAYPFTSEKLEMLKEIEKAKAEAQTLESLLVSGDLNYVIGKDGAKVLVSDLVGKNILLYFSADWCIYSREFLPNLIEEYNKLKESFGESFEMIFISSDSDQASFDICYSGMPWLALPFGDPRGQSVSQTLKVSVLMVPKLVAIAPTGETITKEGRKLVVTFGADAFPFTGERIEEMQVKYEDMAKEWPKRVVHPIDEEHELELMGVQHFVCDKCLEDGNMWKYSCFDCEYELHPRCALWEAEVKQANGDTGEGEFDHDLLF